MAIVDIGVENLNGGAAKIRCEQKIKIAIDRALKNRTRPAQQKPVVALGAAAVKKRAAVHLQ